MESILNFGLEVYQKTGAVGLLLFLLILCLFVVGSLYVRSAKKQSGEVSDARKEVKEIQAEMRKQLEEMLEDCRRECDAKELELRIRQEALERMMNRVRELETSELHLHRELNVLRNHVRRLQGNTGEIPIVTPPEKTE